MNKTIKQTLERKTSNDKDLVELAGYDAYQYNKIRDVINVNGNEYIVKNTKYKDPSGLDALTVQKVGTKELTIIFVGTDANRPNGQQDLITDLKLLGDVTPAQLTAANRYYEQMKAKYEKGGYKIKSTCGNSLAGALVSYIAIKHPEIKGVTLNPALLPKGVIKHNQEYSNITNYFSKYDPLTLGEKAGYLDGRIPGAHYIINNGIPEINKEKGLSNHIGYNSDQYYLIGVNGKPGYGKIYIAADDHIVTSIWRGTPLYGGHSKPIKINKYELDQLVDALKNNIHDVQYACVNSYLTNSKEIVDDEGRKITQRISILQSEYEQTFEESAGSNLFKDIAKASNRLSNEIDNLITLLDSAESKSEAVNRIINSAPSKMIEYVVCNAIAEFAFEEARNLLGNLARKVRELSNGINYIVVGIIPNLIKGTAQKFNDAIVNELQAHFQITLRNKDKVGEQILNFAAQVQGTADSFQEVDKNIGNAIANNEKISTPNYAQETNTYILEDSPYMAMGLRLKEIELKLAVNSFFQASSLIVMPVLASIEGILIAAELSLEQLSTEIKGATNLALYGTLPGAVISLFTKFDDKIKNSVKHALAPVDEALEIIKPIRILISRAIIFYPNLVKNFEPYIDSALFNKSSYYNVNQYNTAATSVLEEMEILFADIAQQLTNQKGKAIDALGLVAEDVLKNIKKLHSQVSLVTVKS